MKCLCLLTGMYPSGKIPPALSPGSLLRQAPADAGIIPAFAGTYRALYPSPEPAKCRDHER